MITIFKCTSSHTLLNGCSSGDLFILICRYTIIWRLQVQSWLQVSNNTGILNTCTRLWLTESEQSTPMDSIKDVVQSSVKVPEFDKHLKKTGGHIIVEITIKMKTIVQKPLMINKLIESNKDNLLCYTILSIFTHTQRWCICVKIVGL